MDNKQDESDNVQNTKSLIKSQSILKKAINSINLEKEQYKNGINNAALVKQNTTFSKSKAKNFYSKYKSYLTNTIYLLNKYKSLRYSHEKNFSKYKIANPNLYRHKVTIYLNKLFVIKLSLRYFIKTKINKLKSNYRNFEKSLIITKPSITESLVKQVLFAEKYFLYYLITFNRKLENNIFSKTQQLNNSNLANTLKKTIKKFESKIKKITEKLLTFTISFDRKTILKYLARFGFILKIYFLPFIFLANQALIPFIQEYEELVVNSFSSFIFERIPFLISIIKLFNPIINSFNKMFQFWVLIAYFLIFPLGYRSLKLSYKLGYNGSIALIFLLINSSLSFSQEIIIAIFESLKIIKDILFTSYLVKHLGKSKNKEREEALRIFNNLVQRYELEIRQDYFNWLLFLNHYVLSPLAFISIAVLVYNCLYYIIYNKNPKIPLVTKAALATIKNPQEEE
jgi:hypothetical protein